MAARRSATSRLLRFVGFGLLNLIVLVIVVALAAPLFFDPNDYKDTIAEQVRQRTGRDITIAGDMTFSVLPWLGVSVGEVTLGNAAGFGDAPFAKVASADVRVKLVPLLSREVRMDTVSVTGLELNLARDADGRGNWEDLAGAGGAAEQPAGGDARALAAFALGGVRVEDAAVTYRDAVSGQQLALTDLDLRTGPVSLGDPVDAELSLRFTHPDASGRASGSTHLTYDLSGGRYGAEGLALQTEVTAAALGNAPAKATLSGDVLYDQAARQASARGLKLALDTPAPAGSGIAGNVTVNVAGDVSYDDAARRVSARGLTLAVDTPAPADSGLAGRIALNAAGDADLNLAEGTLTSPALSLKADGLRQAGDGGVAAAVQLDTALAASLAGPQVAMSGLRGEGRVSGGPLGTTPLPVSLGGNVTLDLAKDTLVADELRVAAAGLDAAGAVQVSDVRSAPRASGRIVAPAFDLKALLARAGIALPALKDPNAFSRVALSTQFAAEAGALRLDDLTLELDGAKATGRARATAAGAAAFDLTVDRMDVDRYLPAAAPGAPPPAAAGALPVKTLRGLDIDGRLRAGALRYAGLDLAKVDVGVKAKDGLLRLDPLKADLFGGSYAGNIRVDARGETPVMTLDERVTQVDAAALLAALGVSTAPLDLSGGRSNLSVKGTVATDPAGRRVRASGLDVDARVGGRSFAGGPVLVGLTGDIAVDLEKHQAALEGVRARVAEYTVDTRMQVDFAPGAMGYRGRLAMAPFNAKKLAGRVGVTLPHTADPAALTAVGFSAEVAGTADRVAITSLAADLDGSKINGDLAVTNFASPAFAFDLKVDRLDADRYLPPQAKGKAATPGAAATALPVDLVRSLNLDGTLTVGALKVGGVRMSDVKFTAVGKDGKLSMSPLAATLYGGRYAGNVVVDARERVPRLTLDETIQGVQVGDLLRDVTGDAPVSGAADLRAVLAAQGGDGDALKRTLGGDVRFSIRDGALEKVDMVSSMCGALAAVDFDNLNRQTIAAGVIGLLMSTQRPAAAAAQGGSGTRTEFTEMSGSARIDNGIARNRDLLMVSPAVRVRGAGAVNLPAAQLDYRAEAELVQSCAGIGKRDLAGQIIPVNITGPIASPKVQPEIPVGLIKALRERRTPPPAAPGAAPPPTAQQPPPQQAPPQQPAAPAPAPSDPKDLLRGILQGIIKKQ